MPTIFRRDRGTRSQGRQPSWPFHRRREVARYIGLYGTKRVAKAVLIAAVPPIMLKSATNPEGLPIEVFDDMRSGLTKDRSQFYKDLAMAFYGANREGAKVSRESWISSGFGACRPASRMPMKASRPSPRPISPKTSRSSMSQPWLCMVRTTRSFPSRTRLTSRPGSSKARRKSTILARLMASRPRIRIRSTLTLWPS